MTFSREEFYGARVILCNSPLGINRFIPTNRTPEDLTTRIQGYARMREHEGHSGCVRSGYLDSEITDYDIVKEKLSGLLESPRNTDPYFDLQIGTFGQNLSLEFRRDLGGLLFSDEVPGEFTAHLYVVFDTHERALLASEVDFLNSLHD